MTPRPTRLAVFGVLLATAGCARLDHIGQPPTMNPIGPSASQERIAPRDLARRLPAPSPGPALPNQPGSLWQTGSQSFLYDNRASKIGDILTVLIDLDEEATIENQTDRTRDGEEKMGVPNFFGLESKLNKIFPDAVDPEKLVGTKNSSTTGGKGKSKRKEKIQVKLAAMITEILPNGNLVVAGSQEMRVNFDLREIQLAGVIRPQDITSANTITYDKVAEARISYGGRGQLMDLQQPRYGQQVLDVVLPF